MIRAALALALSLLLGACAGQGLTGIAAGVGENMGPPRPPLADPAQATFQFLPIPGIPVQVADELLSRIWRRAEREGLNVVKRPGGPALFTVEGTVVGVSDDTNSTIFFTFNVLDTTGRRLHTISGIQNSEETDGDPWSNLEDRDLDLIALRLAALLRAWLYAEA